MGNRYKAYGLIVDSGALSDQAVGGMMSVGIDPGLDEWLNAPDGGQSFTDSRISEGRPVLDFTGFGVKEILDMTGMTGLVYSTAGTKDGCTTYLRRAGTTGSVNKKIVSAQGVLIPQQIQAREKQPALISFMLAALSADGVTFPITWTGSQALAGTPVITTMFATGPVSLAGTTIELKSWTYDFGLNWKIENDAGLAYPTIATLVSQRPKLVIPSDDLDAVDTLGIGGHELDGETVVAYLRKADTGSTPRVADATSEHISITFNAGRIKPTKISAGDGGSLAMGGWEISPIYDGTNAVAVLDTTAAIS